jgi:hypothetical protein
MEFLGFNSMNEADAIGRREDEARRKREASPAYQLSQSKAIAKRFIMPAIARDVAKREAQGRRVNRSEIDKAVMKINRPPTAGIFMKVAPSVAVPVEKMVM